MMFADCPTCAGEGALLSQGRPGAFSAHEEAYDPSETWLECLDCLGEGRLEVCGECREPWRVVAGLEVCGCRRAPWLQAA